MGTPATHIEDRSLVQGDGIQCRTCLYFEIEEGNERGVGRCRRHAPTLGGFPIVLQEDWCGDYEPDANKAVQYKRTRLQHI